MVGSSGHPLAHLTIILEKAHALLKTRFEFYFVTLQIETACLDETGAEEIDALAQPAGG